MDRGVDPSGGGAPGLGEPTVGGGGGAAAAVSTSSLASKRVVHVGGLADKATAAGLRAACIPFGSIRSVDMPMDYAVGKHRGFAFVEYHSPEDAEEAAFNLDGSDFLGRTLRVSLAQPNQAGKLSSSSSGAIAGLAADGSQALWKSDEWFRTQILEDAGGGGAGASEERARRDEAETDAKALRG